MTDHVRSQLLELMESLENEIIALRCLSGLFNGQVPGSGCVDLSELTYLIDPIIEREKVVLDSVRAFLRSPSTLA